ncbi:MAG: carboxypeptidase M32 [Chlamydiia bacterium]
MPHTLKNHLNEIVYLKSISSLLSWDQETLMPAEGAPFRADQSAFVQGLVQEKILSPIIKNFLESEPKDGAEKRQQALLQNEVNEFSIPKDLVEAIAKQAVISVDSWRKAREENNFSLFKNDLKKMIELQQQLADQLRGNRSRYDALLAFYDRDLTFAAIEKLFSPIEKELKELIHRKKFPHRKAHPFPVPLDIQKKLCEEIAQLIAPKSLLAVSTHPFCSSLGPNDVRLSTRYKAEDLADALFSTLHELGHALYDQQLPHEAPYPLNQALSLTVHESQSKLFETCISGSNEFLTFLYSRLKALMPTLHLSLEEFIESRLAVRPHPIRIESDECTYPLHIIFRTKIEHDLIEGDLSVDDLPHTFRQYQKELLGLDVTKDSDGCLQDIHWAGGYFGYFPTYLTGCMYASDQYATMQGLFDMPKHLSKGDLEPIRNWLKTHIHGLGSLYPLHELLKHSTKKELTPERYLDYLKGRFLA